MLFPSGSLQEKLNFYNQFIVGIPTDKQVQSGLAFNYKDKDAMVKALENGDNATFEKYYDQANTTWTRAYKSDMAKYENAAAALANVTDVTGLPPSEAQSILNSGTAKDKADELAYFQDIVGKYGTYTGTEVPEPKIVKDAQGYYQLASSVPQKGNTMNAGEPLGIRQNDSGAYEIYGTNTNTVFDTANDLQGALIRQQEIQGGSTPGLTAQPVTSGAGQSSILDAAGVNYNGLTDSEIKDLETIYQGAGDSPDLLNKALQSPDVFDATALSDEDITNFYDQAKEFIAGKGSNYEQAFTRGRENYELTMQNQADQRAMQLDQEKLDKALAIESNDVSAADAGLAFSGIRNKAQARLEEQAKNIAESSRTSFDFNTGTYQRDTEDYLGSAALTGAKLPSIEGVTMPTLTSGIRGSLEQQQEVDIQAKADALQAQRQEADLNIKADAGGVSLY